MYCTPNVGLWSGKMFKIRNEDVWSDVIWTLEPSYNELSMVLCSVVVNLSIYLSISHPCYVILCFPHSLLWLFLFGPKQSLWDFLIPSTNCKYKEILNSPCYENGPWQIYSCNFGFRRIVLELTCTWTLWRIDLCLRPMLLEHHSTSSDLRQTSFTLYLGLISG